VNSTVHITPKNPLVPCIRLSRAEIDKLIWREWAGQWGFPGRFDPDGVLTDLHAARLSQSGWSDACQHTASVVNQLARSWDLPCVRLLPQDLTGSADRSAERLLEGAHFERLPDAPSRRAMLLELVLSVEEVAGASPPTLLFASPFRTSRLALQEPWSEHQLDAKLTTLILQEGDGVLTRYWPDRTLADVRSDLWPHALLVQRARGLGRFHDIAASARRDLRPYIRACVEDGVDVLIRMLARMGFPQLGESLVGAAFQAEGPRRHPVRVEMLHPGSQPMWWSPRCRELIHLGSCKQVTVVRERWGQKPGDDAILVQPPSPGWRPEDERAIGDRDVTEPIPF